MNREGWPEFRWDHKVLDCWRKCGTGRGLFGRMQGLGFGPRSEAMVQS